jgi:hypothetical protein
LRGDGRGKATLSLVGFLFVLPILRGGVGDDDGGMVMVGGELVMEGDLSIRKGLTVGIYFDALLGLLEAGGGVLGRCLLWCRVSWK